MFRYTSRVISKSFTPGKKFSTKCTNPDCVYRVNALEDLYPYTNKRIYMCVGFFAIGGCVEAYTFSKTSDIRSSTGLGWAILACLFV